MPDVDSLRQIPLFAGLPDAELEAVSSCLVRRVFGKGVFIFHKDSPGRTLYVIVSGRVRIFVVSESGQEISLDMHGAGDVIGELGFVDGKPRSTSAVASEPTTAYVLRREGFFGHLGDYPQLAVGLLEILAARLRNATAFAESLAFLDVNGRVALRLVELGDRFGVEPPRGAGVELDLPLTQAELAGWVASSRETVNKVLSALRDQGLIALSGQKITILNRPGLLEKACY